MERKLFVSRPPSRFRVGNLIWERTSATRYQSDSGSTAFRRQRLTNDPIGILDGHAVFVTGAQRPVVSWDHRRYNVQGNGMSGVTLRDETRVIGRLKPNGVTHYEQDDLELLSIASISGLRIEFEPLLGFVLDVNLRWWVYT